MTYPEAQEAMRNGYAVTREFWDDGDPQPPILFIRPEWTVGKDSLGIVQSIPTEVKRFMRNIDFQEFEFSETLCYYQAGLVINGFLPTVTDTSATDWYRLYP